MDRGFRLPGASILVGIGRGGKCFYWWGAQEFAWTIRASQSGILGVARTLEPPSCALTGQPSGCHHVCFLEVKLQGKLDQTRGEGGKNLIKGW
jgi:hypothetical protein